MYFATRLDTKHITRHMVPSFLYNHTKSALPGTPPPSNPSWSTETRKSYTAFIHKYCDRQSRVNNADPNQMPHSVSSDEGLYGLPLIQQPFRHTNRQ